MRASLRCPGDTVWHATEHAGEGPHCLYCGWSRTVTGPVLQDLKPDSHCRNGSYPQMRHSNRGSNCGTECTHSNCSPASMRVLYSRGPDITCGGDFLHGRPNIKFRNVGAPHQTSMLAHWRSHPPCYFRSHMGKWWECEKVHRGRIKDAKYSGKREKRDSHSGWVDRELPICSILATAKLCVTKHLM